MRISLIIKLRNLCTANLIYSHLLYGQMLTPTTCLMLLWSHAQPGSNVKTLVGYRVNFSRAKSWATYPICSVVSNEFEANLGGEQVRHHLFVRGEVDEQPQRLHPHLRRWRLRQIVKPEIKGRLVSYSWSKGCVNLALDLAGQGIYCLHNLAPKKTSLLAKGFLDISVPNLSRDPQNCVCQSDSAATLVRVRRAWRDDLRLFFAMTMLYFSLSLDPMILQGSTNRRAPGFVNFVLALAYHFSLNLHAALTQPGARLLVEPCTHGSMRNLRINLAI